MGMVASPTAIIRRSLLVKPLGLAAPGYSAVVRIHQEVEIKDEYENQFLAPAKIVWDKELGKYLGLAKAEILAQ